MKIDRRDVIFILGLGLLAGGIGMLSIPAAMITVGVVLIAVGLAGAITAGRRVKP